MFLQQSVHPCTQARRTGLEQGQQFLEAFFSQCAELASRQRIEQGQRLTTHTRQLLCFLRATRILSL
jgi:hypothetical protein